ncbi:MAG: pyridoxal 5'-phosphate synthase glutaminase subunit PdxT [Candidatus Peregrinibacteria bacterium]
MAPLKIGILGFHGSREEHANSMQKLGFQTVFLRTPEDFHDIAGIILPGGESGSFGRSLLWSGVREMLAQKILQEKIPVFGTCAGSILLAKNGSEYSLGAIDMDVDRNAYGRQVDSFSTEIVLPGEELPFHAIFIRAPKIIRVGQGCKILAEHAGNPILVHNSSQKILVSSFHPELTPDTRIHKIFAEMVSA